MRQRLFLLIKLAVSVAALALIARTLDFDEVWSVIRGANIGWLLVAIVLMLLATPVMGLRLQAAAGCIDLDLDASRAVRYTFIGLFFNQVLPTSFGGDGVRIWLLLRDKEPTGKAVHAVLLDRIAALIVLGIMIGLFLPLLSGFMPAAPLGILAMVSAAVVGGLIALWLFAPPIVSLLSRWSWTRRLANFASDTRALITAGWSTVRTILLTASAHLMAGIAIYALARAFGVAPEPLHVIVLTNAIFLSAAIPLSIAGWGIREQAMAYFLGMIGVSKAVAISISITFGLIMILVALPGLILWWVRPKRHSGDPSIVPQTGT